MGGHAVVVALVVLLLQQHGVVEVRGEQCNAGVVSVKQSNAWCEVMEEATQGVSLDSCCAGGESNSRRLLKAAGVAQDEEEATCRGAEYLRPYCDEEYSRCEDYLGEKDTLTINLELENLGQTASCCDTCSCFGDPECISFDGTRDEWILCDGRNNNTCTVTQRKCEKKKDHAGNACQYIKDDPTKWVSREISGSPCQPDWALSGYPSMTMYETGGFKTELTLGERGVIRELSLALSSGEKLRINADKCFSQGTKAWKGGSIPDGWESSTTRDADGDVVQVEWNVHDPEIGVYISFSCTSPTKESQKRIDIGALIETNPERSATGSGVCVSGSISEKGGPRLKEKLMHKACLSKNIPGPLAACKTLVDPLCNPNTLEANIIKWCAASDLTQTSISSAEQCVSSLTTGHENERAAAWTELVCEIHQQDVEQCTSLISQFGWNELQVAQTPPPSPGTNYASSCSSNLEDYMAAPSACTEGVSIEYLSGGEWQHALFVPAVKPPCGGRITVSGDQLPELFKNPIRVVQCDLKPECLLQNSCRETQALDVSVSYSTRSCPCPNPVIPNTEVSSVNLYDEYEVDATIELEEQVCSGEVANLFQIGCGAGTGHPIQVNVKDCTLKPEVLVTVLGTDEPTRCTFEEDLPLHKSFDMKVKVTRTHLVVSLDGKRVCREALPGPPVGGNNLCVYKSAPSKPAANACVEVSVSSESMAPTPAPTCLVTNEPDNVVNRYDVFGAFQATLGARLSEKLCIGENANVFQLGCGDDVLLSLDMEDCSEDIVASLFVIGSSEPVTCRVENAVSTNFDTELRVDASPGVLQVFVDNVMLCKAEFNGVMKDYPSACLYMSAPNKPTAQICSDGMIFSSNNGPECQCVREPESFEICDGQGEQKLGACPECCPERPAFSSESEAICQEIVMEKPYCDTSNAAVKDKCPRLKSEEGKLTLSLEWDLDSETTCCESCICYGDPECQAFDGSTDKWILCDARLGAEEDCKVDKDVCGKELDHMGNSCVWHEDVARKIGSKRAEIGAFGSPCVADFDVSGPAYMTMYQIPGFTSRISMGERGVIEELELTTGNGTFALIADKCFTHRNSWEVQDENLLSLTEALEIKTYAGPGKDEKTLEIFEPVSQIFIRAVCIRQQSVTSPKVISYRLNINNLVETDATRARNEGEGYCARENAVIDVGLATRANTDAIYDECMTGLADTHHFCKLVWTPSCTQAQVPEGIKEWCATANVYPNDANRVSTCIKYIGTSSKRWMELYCDSINANRPPSMNAAVWRQECMARLDTDGYAAVIDEFGTGRFGSNTNVMCGADETAYAPRSGEQKCLHGLSVQYLSNKGQWKEALFIPVTLPPCGGKLELSAKKHYELFTRPIRIENCEVDPTECSVDMSCIPFYRFEMGLDFTESNEICGTEGQTLRLR
eukprot:CAMPEP_0184553728 /NCGR_PEP_ID=MMETSP0199_2-20130426/33053_1 /TAXON_ID=1112570 /ORGANISM="Thraustochytrium sp., Strain LLF1b" /LENGTH=1415 /DNA_ID=CAMNT_0026949571 /DNA_START=78 /DNA_END=4325 /DNA_ORIENTATION=-